MLLGTKFSSSLSKFGEKGFGLVRKIGNKIHDVGKQGFGLANKALDAADKGVKKVTDITDQVNGVPIFGVAGNLLGGAAGQVGGLSKQARTGVKGLEKAVKAGEAGAVGVFNTAKKAYDGGQKAVIGFANTADQSQRNIGKVFKQEAKAIKSNHPFKQ